MNDKNQRLLLAKKSLEGLAIGDCFGQSFFGNMEMLCVEIASRKIRAKPWNFTDDTVMGIGIYKVLEEYENINQDKLSKVFGGNYLKDWHRGYGGTAHSILRAIAEGEEWQSVSSKAFDGMGSMGNGAAMRAALIGAYFYDNIEKAIAESRLSAMVTHYNEEGIAGAIAISVAAAQMVNYKNGTYQAVGNEFILDLVEKVPESDTKYKIKAATQVRKESHIDFAVSVLGNGLSVMAKDTVPIAIWCAAHYMDHLEEALWKAVSALGDMDTICAMVGSIVILNDNRFPYEWKNYLENPFESEFFL